VSYAIPAGSDSIAVLKQSQVIFPLPKSRVCFSSIRRLGRRDSQTAFEAGSFPCFAKQFVIAWKVAQLFDNLVGRNEVNSSDFLSN
jgi:hypothetical protein